MNIRDVLTDQINLKVVCMTHNQLQRIVIEALEVQGNGFSVVRGNRRGIPDILGHIGGVFIGVEVKVKKDKLSPQQRVTLLNIKAKGGLGIVVHENYVNVFHEYVQRIKREVISNAPIYSIGKPTPKELEVDDFNIEPMTATLL